MKAIIDKYIYIKVENIICTLSYQELHWLNSLESKKKRKEKKRKGGFGG